MCFFCIFSIKYLFKFSTSHLPVRPGAPAPAAAAAEEVAEALSGGGGEEAVDERVGGRVEGRQALDEGGHRLVGGVVGDAPVDLRGSIPAFIFFKQNYSWHHCKI